LAPGSAPSWSVRGRPPDVASASAAAGAASDRRQAGSYPSRGSVPGQP
jgi:hypothetical protein